MNRFGPVHRCLGASLLLAASTLASPAFAQKLGQGGGVEIAWWRVAGALAVCLLLAVAGAFTLRARLRAGASAPRLNGLQAWSALADGIRKGVARPEGKARRLKEVETLRLNHNVELCLLECDGEDFIIATSPQGAFLVKSTHPQAGRVS